VVDLKIQSSIALDFNGANLYLLSARDHCALASWRSMRKNRDHVSKANVTKSLFMVKPLE
jgi:hypothetical protein